MMDFDSLQNRVRDVLFKGDFSNRQTQITSKTTNKDVLELVQLLDPNQNQSILEILPTTRSLKESIALLRYNYRDKDYPNCRTCGKKITRFSNPSGPNGRPYKKYCSNKCASNCPEVKEQNAKSVSKSLKKAYKDRGFSIKAKRAKTLKERFDSDGTSSSPFSVPEIQTKAVETVKKKYGVQNIFMLESVKKNAQTSLLQKYKELQARRGLDVEYNVEDETVTIKNCCHIHGDCTLTGSQFNNRTKPDRIENRSLCPICSPDVERSSELEDVVFDIILKIDPSLKVLRNDRKLICPKEIDLLIPEKKLAIEVNGLFWHSSLFKDRMYHFKKRQLVEEKGFQLISLWEDQVRSCPDKIENLLRSKLGCNKRIFARKCAVKPISLKEAREFTNQYHLQGHVNAKDYIGLFYGDELVELMSFGFPRFKRSDKDRKSTIELYRLCTKAGYTVVGGASKLFQYYIQNLLPSEVLTIESYCHSDISNGSVYEILGFSLISEGPSLYYADLSQSELERISRYTYIKREKTDSLVKIHDSGVRTYSYTL